VEETRSPAEDDIDEIEPSSGPNAGLVERQAPRHDVDQEIELAEPNFITL
jgi:hypothetical protein